MPRGNRRAIFAANSRRPRKWRELNSRDKYALIAPTGGAIDMSLSLRITINRERSTPALFIASYAIPALIAPSPITAMTCRFSAMPRPAFRSRATAMPTPADIDVLLCPAPNGSYSLSARLVNPDSPPPWRSVRIRSRRPVRILCG